MAGSNRTKNQHYVPQFVLQRFSNAAGKLWVYDKWTRKRFLSSPRNVAAENAFYDCEFNGELISLESAMCDIEASAVGTLNSIVENRSLASMSADGRQSVARFLAIQMMRTRAAREEFQQMQDSLREGLRVRELDEALLPPGFFVDEEGLKQGSLSNLSVAAELMPHLLDKAWLLDGAPDGKAFIISDNPLVRRNATPPSPYWGNNGLACPGIQIYMPLSPTLTLCLLCQTLIQPFREHEPGPTAKQPNLVTDAIDFGLPFVVDSNVVIHQNSLQVASSSRFLFSASDEFSLADEMLRTNPELVRPKYVGLV